MELLTRTAKKFRSLRFGPLPCVMFLFMTVRTFLSGNAIMLSGLCVACLPFFAQLRNTSCKEPDVSEHKEIFSLYLFNLLLLTIGMLYLRGLTFFGSLFYTGYEASPILHELFLLTFLCDLAFISIITPLTYTLPQQQRTILAILLINLEIGFMVFANKMLLLSPSSFVLEQQWGLYLLAVILPVLSLGSVCMSKKRKQRTVEKNWSL